MADLLDNVFGPDGYAGDGDSPEQVILDFSGFSEAEKSEASGRLAVLHSLHGQLLTERGFEGDAEQASTLFRHAFVQAGVIEEQHTSVTVHKPPTETGPQEPRVVTIFSPLHALLARRNTELYDTLVESFEAQLGRNR